MYSSKTFSGKCFYWFMICNPKRVEFVLESKKITFCTILVVVWKLISFMFGNWTLSCTLSGNCIPSCTLSGNCIPSCMLCLETGLFHVHSVWKLESFLYTVWKLDSLMYALSGNWSLSCTVCLEIGLFLVRSVWKLNFLMYTLSGNLTLIYTLYISNLLVYYLRFCAIGLIVL